MNLKDQIDEPLLKSVMAINLLGATTVWTCCGYDYPGQPENKGHLYGLWQIHLLANDAALTIGTNIIKMVPGVSMKCGNLTNIPVISLTVGFREAGLPDVWLDKKSPHAHEIGAMYSSLVEKRLLELPNNLFKEVTILIDTNDKAKEAFKYWAHPVSEPWVITKEELFR